VFLSHSQVLQQVAAGKTEGGSMFGYLIASIVVAIWAFFFIALIRMFTKG